MRKSKPGWDKEGRQPDGAAVEAAPHGWVELGMHGLQADDVAEFRAKGKTEAEDLDREMQPRRFSQRRRAESVAPCGWYPNALPKPEPQAGDAGEEATRQPPPPRVHYAPSAGERVRAVEQYAQGLRRSLSDAATRGMGKAATELKGHNWLQEITFSVATDPVRYMPLRTSDPDLEEEVGLPAWIRGKVGPEGSQPGLLCDHVVAGVTRHERD